MLKTLFENATHSKMNIVTYKNANFNQVIYILCKKGSNFWLSDVSIKCTLLEQSLGQNVIKKLSVIQILKLHNFDERSQDLFAYTVLVLLVHINSYCIICRK